VKQMKKIAIGTMNPAKVSAVQAVFSAENYILVPTTVSSNVAAQPFSDEETLTGAINRAKNALKKENADIGIGLEGGVVEMNKRLWVCNWGALVDKDGIVVSAGGARIPLPPEAAQGVRDGKELGDVMDEYTGMRNIRKKEGAVGVFTNGYINRAEMFTHIVKLLAGQYEFQTNYFVKTDD
jgi:inosine/xanthosine triphosphatase